jgi:hypothetical protein
MSSVSFNTLMNKNLGKNVKVKPEPSVLTLYSRQEGKKLAMQKKQGVTGPMPSYLDKLPGYNKKYVSFDENTESQKRCVPGPNVTFPDKKGTPSFYSYLMNINNKGSLGCGPEQYPKYSDGKYCCVDSPVTNQEHLDYVNNLLEAAIKNVGEDSFKKYIPHIKFIIDRRDELLSADNTLIDDITVPEPFTSLDEWFESNGVPPSGGRRKTKRTKRTKIKKSRKSRKSRKRNKK